MTSLLVLGGTGFAGRAIVQEAVAWGWEVATFNRGRRGRHDPRVQAVVGERGDPATLAPLAKRNWDLVADTWSGAPRAARASAAALADHAARYVYISSGSVYRPPLLLGLDETTATIPAQLDADDGPYPANKRGAELAVARSFGDRALLARVGLLVGPYDDSGRLPWWLQRMSDGGDVLAPEPRSLPLQLLDVRDLARFVLDAEVSGPCNVVSRRGHATMQSLLRACRETAGAPGTRLRWAPVDVIERVGIEPWTELPMWLAPGSDDEGLMAMNTDRADGAGLRCRPVAETVADTWAWMQSLPAPPSPRADRPVPGVPAAKERAALHHL